MQMIMAQASCQHVAGFCRYNNTKDKQKLPGFAGKILHVLGSL
jgi:hypothetical protein